MTPKFDDLKPCPFCGNDATCTEKSHGHASTGLFTTTFSIGCNECKITFVRESQFRLKGSAVEFVNDGYAAARDAWNRRA